VRGKAQVEFAVLNAEHEVGDLGGVGGLKWFDGHGKQQVGLEDEAFNRLVSCGGRLAALQDGGNALAAPDALRSQGVAATRALQEARGFARDAGPRGSQRVADGDAAPIQI
jgi:hypothetical protein